MAEPLSLKANDAVFTKATPEQRKAIWKLNGASWALPLSLKDYMAREEYLSQQLLSADGRCSYWVLHLKGYPNLIIASCESTRKDLFISENGVCRRAVGYAIASVFTNPLYRRQGYAALLLTRLQETVDKTGELSVLYSDIGKLYYSRLGWVGFPSEQATLTLLSSERGFASVNPGRTRPLTVEMIPALCEKDEAALAKRFEAIPNDGKTHIAFAPSWPQVQWQLTRAPFMARRLMDKELTTRGAITTEGTAWIYWDHDWREKKLKVLRIVTALDASSDQRADAIGALLEAALAEANESGLAKVLVWNPDEATTLGCKKVANSHEDEIKLVFNIRLDGSLPSLRWQGGKSMKDIVWHENFYYCWC